MPLKMRTKLKNSSHTILMRKLHTNWNFGNNRSFNTKVKPIISVLGINYHYWILVLIWFIKLIKITIPIPKI